MAYDTESIHRHAPLPQRDSMSKTDFEESGFSNSEQNKFLSSVTNSSTRSNTIESGINRLNAVPSSVNAQPPNTTTSDEHNQPVRKKRSFLQGTVVLSPIHSGAEISTQKGSQRGSNDQGPITLDLHTDKHGGNHDDSAHDMDDTDEDEKEIGMTPNGAVSTSPSLSPAPATDEHAISRNNSLLRKPYDLKNMRLPSTSSKFTQASSPTQSNFVFCNTDVIDSTSVIMPSRMKKSATSASYLPDADRPAAHSNSVASHTKEPRNTTNTTTATVLQPSKPRGASNAAVFPRRHKRRRRRKSCCRRCRRSCAQYRLAYTEWEKASPGCLHVSRVQYLGRKYITTSRIFKYFILLCILANCVFIAMEDPTADIEDSETNQLVQSSEIVFAIIFTLEMFIKMFCNGLFGVHLGGGDRDDVEKERELNRKHSKEKAKETSPDQINGDTVDRPKQPSMDMVHTVELAAIHGDQVMSDYAGDGEYEFDHDERERERGASGTSSQSQATNMSVSDAPNDVHADRYVGYFRDNWNILDFVIVLTSWVELVEVGGGNLTAIRILRVLRPLRTFTKIKALKVLIATILKSLRGLSDVMVLLLFLFAVFAIIGIQLFSGRLHWQCFGEDFRGAPRDEWCCDDPTKWTADENFCVLRATETGNNDTSFNGCPPELPWCLDIAPNPNGGVTSFDNIVVAMLNVFVIVSLEGWAAIQYKLEDTGATLAWLYFVGLTFIVGFFATNLCLAVIEAVYGHEMEKKRKREQKDGADEFETRARQQTQKAWRKEKATQMSIIQSPKVDRPRGNDDGGGHETTGKRVTFAPQLNHQTDDVLVDGDADDDDDDDSMIRMQSYKMPYINKSGQENEFRIRMTSGGHGGQQPQKQPSIKHMSQSTPVRTEEAEQKTDGDGSGNDKVPMSVHSAGLIHVTNANWHALNHGNKTSNAEKRKSQHHRQRSTLKLQKKKKSNDEFQHGLGLGSQSFMHRYRGGALTRTAANDNKGGGGGGRNSGHRPSLLKQFTVSQQHLPQLPPKPQTKRSNSHHLQASQPLPPPSARAPLSLDLLDAGGTDNDDQDVADEQDEANDDVAPLPHELSRNNGGEMSVEHRRRQFTRSRTDRETDSHKSSSRSQLFLGGSEKDKRATLITKSLQKLDFKKQTGAAENAATSFRRILEHTKPENCPQLVSDIAAFKQRSLMLSEEADGDANPMDLEDDADGEDLIRDLAFGDMMVDQREKEQEYMSKELQRRTRRATRKRKANEILARKAILMADHRPAYMDWLDQMAPRNRWVKKMNALVISDLFENAIMLIIVANTIVLALKWPNQSPQIASTLEIINTVFTFIFILECSLKVIGLGPRAYYRDNWNKFDFAIVVVSIAELITTAVTDVDGASNGVAAISALRSLRLLRAFRLLGKFDTLKQLFMLVLEAMHEVSMLTIVLGIFIFMFAALSMSLFAGKLIALGDGRSGRWRFDQFHWAAINVFMVISGDSWNEVMYDTVRATGDAWTVIYYVVVVCFGTFVILNIFVAILLSRMGSAQNEEEFMLDGLVKYSLKMFEHEPAVPVQEQVDRLVMSIERRRYVLHFKDKRSRWKHHRDKLKIEGKSLGIFEPQNRFRRICHAIVHWKWFELAIDSLILVNCVFLALESPEFRDDREQLFFTADILFTVLFVLEFVLKVVALGALQTPFRKKRSWTKVSNDDELLVWTDRSYQAVFFMHTINPKILDLPGLAIECIKSNDGYCIVHLWGQQVLRIVFYEGSFATCYKLKNQERGTWELWHAHVKPPTDKELETVLLSFDLTDHHHNAYFASNWNRLDAVVVFVAVLGAGFNDVSFLRALRAFRPFRIMVRFKKIKVVLGALLRAIPGLLNTVFFCILFWFVLSILGVNWFKGLYRHCVIGDEEMFGAPTADWSGCDAIECCDDRCVMYSYGYDACTQIPGLMWRISAFNFDHVLQALHSLFCMSTLSGWNFVMYEGIDSTTFNAALVEDNKPHAAAYFVCVVVLCAFFSINLIVSVVVDNFNKIKAEKDGSAFQTEEQAVWVNNQRLLERISLGPLFSAPSHWFRRWSFYIVQSDFFEPFIMLCIILNAVSMSLEHYKQDATWTLVLQVADVFFVVIFMLEVIVKIASWGFRLYILSNWNKFDFVISIVGVVGLATNSGLGLSVLRLFRVGRLLRLLHKAKTLKMLFWTLVYSIPSLWNIGLLLFVIFFIYAVVAMHILNDYPTAVQDKVNAANFANAFALLYRVGTEDGWTDIYASYLYAYPDGERLKVYAFFISFFVVGTLVLINLFIAVVLDSFEENQELFSREDKFYIMQIWRDIWSFFDADASKFIPVTDFIDILKLTPQSPEFEQKHRIKGHGFHRGNPFKTLYERMEAWLNSQQAVRGSSMARRSWMRLSRSREFKENLPEFGAPEFRRNLSFSMTSDGNVSETDDLDANQSMNKAAFYTRRLQNILDVDARKKQLRQMCPTVDHEDMLKLLIRLRVTVSQDTSEDYSQLTCFGKLTKLVYDICLSMGIRSEASEELYKQHTKRGSQKGALTANELQELQQELQNDLAAAKKKPSSTQRKDEQTTDEAKTNNNEEEEEEEKYDHSISLSNGIAEPDFDVDDKMWYISYDDALLALCSEVVGPRLPDGLDIFAIDSNQPRLRIAEWYVLKHGCYDVYKQILLAIEANKQFSKILPSRHVSDARQKQLQLETQNSVQYRQKHTSLVQQINGLSLRPPTLTVVAAQNMERMTQQSDDDEDDLVILEDRHDDDDDGGKNKNKNASDTANQQKDTNAADAASVKLSCAK